MEQILVTPLGQADSLPVSRCNLKMASENLKAGLSRFGKAWSGQVAAANGMLLTGRGLVLLC